MRLSAATLSVALITCPLAWCPNANAQPDAYARHWPVQVDDSGIYVVTLTPPLYAQIEDPDLGDLAAFNSSGEALGFEPLASIWKIPPPQWRAAHWFALPATEPGREDGLSLQVERAADGRVSLRAEVVPAAESVTGGDLLIDTGIDPQPSQRLQALAFELDPTVTDFSARVRIEASQDLDTWRPLVDSAGLLRLQQGGQLLERRQIELAGSTARYLRLRRLDGDGPLPLIGLQVQTRSTGAPDPPPMERLTAELVSQEGRIFVYRLPARIPVEQVHLHLARDNTVAQASLASREDERDPWRSRGSLTAFRLRAAGVEVDNEALRLSGSRDRQWRVEVEGDLDEAPRLEFSYRPERWLLLTQGTTPYVIAAGSRRASRHELPMVALLAPIRAKYGADWQPPEATLGEPILVAGDAALEATLQERWSGRVLWLILIGSALAISAMVVSLLKAQTKGGVEEG